MTTARHRRFKVLIGTCPKLEDLVKWFKEIFSNFEVITPTRGVYEFQKTSWTRRFDNWLSATPHAKYQSESAIAVNLPPHIERKYDKWHDYEMEIIDRERFGEITTKPLDQYTSTGQAINIKDLKNENVDLRKQLTILTSDDETPSGLARRLRAYGIAKKLLEKETESLTL